MARKEELRKGKVQDIPLSVLSKGNWGEKISWEFIVSPEPPPRDLCTAVCCIVMYQNKLVLVRNKRGWEFPAGKIEQGEEPETAIRREIAEEAGAIIKKPQLFGHKKLTASEPMRRLDDVSFYPFPDSYFLFFHATAESIGDRPTGADVSEIMLVGYEEAEYLIAQGGQYTNVLEHLMNTGVIPVNQE